MQATVPPDEAKRLVLRISNSYWRSSYTSRPAKGRHGRGRTGLNHEDNSVLFSQGDRRAQIKGERERKGRIELSATGAQPKGVSDMPRMSRLDKMDLLHLLHLWYFHLLVLTTRSAPLTMTSTCSTDHLHRPRENLSTDIKLFLFQSSHAMVFNCSPLASLADLLTQL